MIKKVFTFLLFLLPWFLSSFLFRSDIDYYRSLELPNFAPPSYLFGIIWLIIYILITISVYIIYKEYKFTDQTKSYYKMLVINYILNQLFTFLFFTLKSPFLGMVNAIAVLITSLWLYYETSELNKKAAKLLVPYILWSLFASLLSISIFILNS